MLRHGRELNKYMEQKLRDWLTFKEKPYTEAEVAAWNTTWSIRYKVLLDKHYNEAKDRYDEIERENGDQEKPFDVIKAHREAAAYNDIHIYENADQITKTTDQLLRDDLKRIGEKSAAETVKKELDRIVANQRKKRRL